ncbi:hypothetical protein BDR26DRAFT_940278 [Obelidium mucronatum]|nr:hypothetical protein BDR26DRAFT_940278 [Obelidium mucronatum]
MKSVFLATLLTANLFASAAPAPAPACSWGMTSNGNGGCWCIPGWTQYQNQCCSPNSYYDSVKGCICNPGTTWIASSQTCQGSKPSCPWGMTYNASSGCTCKRGWILAPPRNQCCAPGSTFDTKNGCVCASGLIWDSEKEVCYANNGAGR